MSHLLILASSTSTATAKLAFSWQIIQKDNRKIPSSSLSTTCTTKRTAELQPNKHIKFISAVAENGYLLFLSLEDSVNPPNFDKCASLFLNNLCINLSPGCLFHVYSKPRNYNISWNKMCAIFIIHKIPFCLLQWERYVMFKVSLGFEEQEMKFLWRKIKWFK